MTQIKKFKITIQREYAFTENKTEAKELYTKSRFGELEEDKIKYSLLESLYLLEKKKALLYTTKSKKSLTKDETIKKIRKIDKRFLTRYIVYKELRNRGYIIKTALKFGADFRVYDRGIKPGEDHAKWIVFPINESETMTWYDFAAKNRVAHSTRKKLLLAIVDEEHDVSFWESQWVKP